MSHASSADPLRDGVGIASRRYACARDWGVSRPGLVHVQLRTKLPITSSIQLMDDDGSLAHNCIPHHHFAHREAF